MRNWYFRLTFAFHHYARSLRRFVNLLRESGPRAAFRYVVAGIGEFRRRHNRALNAKRQVASRFDQQWGTDTSGHILASNLDLAGAHALDANSYLATTPEAFQSLITALEIDPADYAFVDFGSGKGRVVLLATEYPFKRITGIELSTSLHKIAEANLAKFQSPGKKCFAVEVLNRDALTHPLPADPTVIYLFNPFTDDKLYLALLANIERSLVETPRDIFIVYKHPDFRKSFDASTAFSVWRELDDAVIYRCVSALKTRPAI
ncbi:MAG: hypothetical protein HY043_04090 [Verrucomicrobia bacterium]|nr:hypothetical protein [Verrucomicrobiota bacterium]